MTAEQVHESFYRRAARRMHELGMITADGLERLLASEEPGPDARGSGIYMALLASALWPVTMTADPMPKPEGGAK